MLYGLQVNEKYDELQAEKKAFYQEQFDSLLQLHCGIDDAHVDYVNIWKRQYDPVKDRYRSVQQDCSDSPVVCPLLAPCLSLGLVKLLLDSAVFCDALLVPYHSLTVLTAVLELYHSPYARRRLTQPRGGQHG